MPATETHMPDAAASAGSERISRPTCAFASTRALSRDELIGAPVRWPRPSRLLVQLVPPTKKVAGGMNTLGLLTVEDLLEHLPSDSREARTVAALKAGEQATVAVQVRAISARPVRRRGMRPLVEATVFDATATMRATFFNQPWLVDRYPPGTRLLLHGKADARGGFSVASHAPGADVADELAAGANAAVPTGGQDGEAVAHYPAAEGITSTQILTLVRAAKHGLADVLEGLSAATRVSEQLPDRASALAAMHFPRLPEDHETGRRRLAFEELLLAQLVFLRRRAARRAGTGAAVLADRQALGGRWLQAGLPFVLTGDQQRAIEAIAADLQQPAPMQRLLMGEVGSGKTVVALYAMLQAVGHGCQAALMAPTETLADQHFATIQQLMGDESVAAALLTGSTPAARRRDILGKLASGELKLVVGTHALIEPDVIFNALAVAVIDEQHRFGVRQRAALGKHEDSAHAGGIAPHTLHMTATPIPRTLALARYGDLDTSTLHELPRGRQPIETRLVSGERERARAYDELRAELAAGHQAYVVCPLIDEAEVGAGASGAAADGPTAELGLRAASAELLRLREGELQGYELALLHGGMRPREKQEAMAAFASGKADVLVATTVIEVGIDVPNATVMLIENAERFGISQLHQLRGRVGRGEHRARCLLVGRAGGTGSGSGRLAALVRHADGFRLAEIDLAMRKEGELVGTRQSGLGQFRVARLPEDSQLLGLARARAQVILAADPELRAPEHALLGIALERELGAQALEPIPA
ncbi:MAG TPA: ATP-dependent DNA helicase RecG [Solirubrobacteraceae bacterium]|jgi:ATP-dependent DNA helicase RecG|nr:ATP-dependent DNA helicase RecG [Solirubrobacteraceae bacterium]